MNLKDIKKYNLVPIDRVDVYQSVLQRIQNMIKEENLKPGDRLPSERWLADALKVSRVSIRQAFKIMQTMGQVEIKRGNGTYVSEREDELLLASLIGTEKVDSYFLQQLSELRAGIECKIIDLIFEREAHNNLKQVFILLEEMEGELESGEEIGNLDIRFEKELVRLVDNPLLERMQQVIHELWLSAWSQLGVAPAEKKQLHAEHMEIAHLIKNRDKAAALESMKQHVDKKCK